MKKCHLQLARTQQVLVSKAVEGLCPGDAAFIGWSLFVAHFQVGGRDQGVGVCLEHGFECVADVRECLVAGFASDVFESYSFGAFFAALEGGSGAVERSCGNGVGESGQEASDEDGSAHVDCLIHYQHSLVAKRPI